MTEQKLFTLLVSNEDNSLESLEALLMSRGVGIWNSRTCAEAARLMDQTHPELIFTTVLLDDGTWRNIVTLAENAPVPTNVIVVGKTDDYRLYIAAMDYGAFDFIVPPFECEPVGHVVRVAAESVRRRRESQAVRAVA